MYYIIWIKLSNKEKDIIIVLLDKLLNRKELAEAVNLKSGSISKYLTKLAVINNNGGVYSIKEQILRRWLNGI